MSSESFRASIVIVIGVVIISLLWSHRYRYVRWNDGVARINRVTGTAQFLGFNGWIQMKNEEEEDQTSSGSEEEKRLSPRARALLRVERVRSQNRIDSLKAVLDSLKKEINDAE